MSDSGMPRHSIILLVGFVLFVFIFGVPLTCAVWNLDSSRLEAGLTNVANVGGIVSGLSLSGTAVLAISGKYASRVVPIYGPLIRFILFGGFVALVLISLTCAMSVLWIEQIWVRVVLGFTPPFMLATLILTAFLISGAFAWSESDREVEKPNPLK